MSMVRVERTLDASAAEVWQALTDEKALNAWFWPPSISPEIRADPRVGGTLRLSATGMGATADYTEVEAPSRFALRWRWDDDDGESTVVVELSPVDDGVRLTLTHDAADDAYENHLQGWSSCLARLPEYLKA